VDLQRSTLDFCTLDLFKQYFKTFPSARRGNGWVGIDFG
jgi:hypothetical protein